MTGDGDLGPRVGVTLGCAGMAVVAVFLRRTESDLPPPARSLLLVVAVVAAVVAVGGVAVLGYPWVSTRGRVRREYGHRGFATWVQLHRAGLTARAVLSDAAVVRPSLAEYTRRELRAVGPGTVASLLGASAVGPSRALELWSSHRDVILGVAPPQTGKTAWLAGRVIDHPGPVVSTSTKVDVWKHTAADRALGGRPVLVFNPENLGKIASTFGWDPLTGCTDSAVAEERAGHLVDGAHPGEGITNGDFFEDQSAKVLKVFLMAAALEGLDFHAVARWVTHPRGRTARDILAKHPDRVPPGWADELDSLQDSPADRASASVFLTLSLATAFMSNPVVAAACRPHPRQGTFDVEAFLAAHGTLYIIGEARKHSPIAPLITALTGHIFEQSKRLAVEYPGERLDPALLMALDEVALITPVPLDEWNADAGGRGIHLIEMAQSLSQLFKRWGERGGQTIINTANAMLYYGGIGVDTDLESISRVCGERPQQTVTVNSGRGDGSGAGRSYATRDVRVITLDRVRRLPKWHMLVVYRNAPPTIVAFTPVWARQDTVAAAARPALRRRERRRARLRGGVSRWWPRWDPEPR